MVAGETWDGDLNDVNGFHVKPEHVFHALDTAKSGPVEEGSVGGGTGMICNEFKGGIGTSLARAPMLSMAAIPYWSVLVQCNYGMPQSVAHRRSARGTGELATTRYATMTTWDPSS